jgi:tetratricopeptide (TPR) repeat protein
MNMKRIVAVAAAFLAAGCSLYNPHRSSNPYEHPFYSKYLNPQASTLDQQIQRDVDFLRADPKNAAVHNDLGQLLSVKGFPKDAETEFERAVNADRHYYPAWYNLGLARSARGDYTGARIAFDRTIHFKPGHSAALFQLGLMEEQRGNLDAAVDLYARAIQINHSVLDVKVNPRVVDSKLMHLALIKAYPNEHSRASMLFQGNIAGYGTRNSAAEPPAPSRQPAAENIVTPAPPVTDPSRQTPAPTPKP